jgi:hypothetical protein
LKEICVHRSVHAPFPSFFFCFLGGVTVTGNAFVSIQFKNRPNGLFSAD